MPPTKRALMLPPSVATCCCVPCTRAGMDVTRKVINLARECGNKIELSAVDTGGWLAAWLGGWLALGSWLAGWLVAVPEKKAD